MVAFAFFLILVLARAGTTIDLNISAERRPVTFENQSRNSDHYHAELVWPGHRYDLARIGRDLRLSVPPETEIRIRGSRFGGLGPRRILPLPRATRERLALALSGGLDLNESDCATFAAFVEGAPEMAFAHGAWAIPAREPELIPGDSVALAGRGRRRVHCATYLGLDPTLGHLYVSQFGTGSSVVVTDLASMIKAYVGRRLMRCGFVGP